MPDSTGTPTRLDAWRASQPFGWDFRTWSTKNGGYVVQLGGWRVFYGRCHDCGTLVTTRRDIRRYTMPRTEIGRWPSYCRECFAARQRKHDAGAKERMRRKRAEQRAFRDAQCAKLGVPPPKPGRPKGR